jgi:erythronate-4-phosphate dehydrogenase
VHLSELLPANWLPELTLSAEADPRWALATLCRLVYDPRRDDADLRRTLVGDAAARRAAFDRLRKHYPMRRETDALAVVLDGEAPALQALVDALGASWSHVAG